MAELRVRESLLELEMAIGLLRSAKDEAPDNDFADRMDGALRQMDNARRSLCRLVGMLELRDVRITECQHCAALTHVSGYRSEHDLLEAVQKGEVQCWLCEEDGHHHKEFCLMAGDRVLYDGRSRCGS